MKDDVAKVEQRGDNYYMKRDITKQELINTYNNAIEYYKDNVSNI